MLAWEITQTKEPCGLQSKGLQRVGHNLATEHTKSHRSGRVGFEPTCA